MTEQHEKQDDQFSELLKEIRRASQDKEANELSALDPLTRAQVKDQETDTDLKKLYARFFAWILALQLLAMDFIFVAVGLSSLKFEDPTHLSLFMGGTLAEVFGVVYVITRYLFSKK